MNKRIRKKKEKQQQERITNLVETLVELKKAIDTAEREYWRQWAEESTRQFVEAFGRYYEQKRRKEELTQSLM